MLGLWGMGGIGKTTLAAKLFNSLLPGFGAAACFLGDVRTEAGSAGGLIKLQQKLLRTLTGTHVPVEDVDHGVLPRRGLSIYSFTKPGSLSMAVCLNAGHRLCP